MTDKPDGKRRWRIAVVTLAVTLLLLGTFYRYRRVSPASITIGQQFNTARESAKSCGYELHDASQLAMFPTPDGFYLDLPDDPA